MLLTNTTKKYTYTYQESCSYEIPQKCLATLPKEIAEPTLLNYYKSYIEQQRKLVGKKIGKKKTKTTIYTYETKHRTMVEFIIYKKGSVIYPKDFTIAVIREFETFLDTIKKHGNDYTMKHIHMLGTILRTALEAGDIAFNPVRDLFDFHYERNYNNIYLSIQELCRFAEKKFKQERLQRVIDIFLFCCYTGLSYVDIKKFRASEHLKIGVDGRRWIVLKRTKNSDKSEEDTFVPLLPLAETILLKYGGEQLPVLSNAKMNSYLKECAEIVGIEKDISFKTSRKTFGMLLLNEYNVPLETVSKMLGHSSVKTTQQFYVNVEMKKIARDMSESETFFTPFTKKSA